MTYPVVVDGCAPPKLRNIITNDHACTRQSSLSLLIMEQLPSNHTVRMQPLKYIKE
jgi:hypothetical protein